MAVAAVSQKRKRPSDRASTEGAPKSRKAPKVEALGLSISEQILSLEQQIDGGRTYYNNIVKLQKLISHIDQKPKTATLAAVSQCRIFCGFIAREKLVRRKQGAEEDTEIVEWLRQRLRDYTASLIGWIGSADGVVEDTALTLLMKVIKAETSQDAKRSQQAWRTENSTFHSVIRVLLQKADAEMAREEFVERYMAQYDDVRFYSFLAIHQILLKPGDDSTVVRSNALHVLANPKMGVASGALSGNLFGLLSSPANHQSTSLNAHRKARQACWLEIFRSQLTTDQRKAILSIITSLILPWFSNRMEILTDFLTDSFNEGGSMALLALSGIFHIMTQHNVDYPEFYTKLYSLVNDEVTQSKHRSRFFRLLDQFLKSSHLPVTIVASFIKRLSRLSLLAPPGAIVWIVPWTYNMLKKHPSCTFMLHRPFHPAHEIYITNADYLETGVRDPFQPDESDPLKTNAIESSLWELFTLNDHWHPNVATLAKIVAEPFTKREYQLEDFLDHSYASLLDAELRKEMKRKIEVEWEIPKRIVTSENGDLNGIGSLLEHALQTT